jgi:hypothetical protein
MDLNKKGVPVYEKADKNSKIASYTPDGITKVETDYRVEGLNEDGLYWHVSHYDNGIFIWGFIHNDFVK